MMDDHQPTVEFGRDDVVAALEELIDALNRRVPQVERVGEIRIALEAAALKKETVARLEQLKRAQSDCQTGGAVMTDDGGRPLRDERRREDQPQP